jgi:large subunit ribosomal protein L21e
MTHRTGTSRYKTRRTLSVAKKLKGKLSISKFLQKFNEGDRVVFKASPSVHAGLYYRRFHGKTGTVIKARGKCYEVKVLDKKREKIVLTNPVHLVKVKNGTKNS